MKMMKLYSYSSDPPAIKEVKWVWAKLAGAALLASVLIFFGIVGLKSYVGHEERSRTEQSLESENRMLRQEVNSISPKISIMEKQTSQLSRHVGVLHALLTGRKTAADSLSRMNAQLKEAGFQIVIPIATTLER